MRGSKAKLLRRLAINANVGPWRAYDIRYIPIPYKTPGDEDIKIASLAVKRLSRKSGRALYHHLKNKYKGLTHREKVFF